MSRSDTLSTMPAIRSDRELPRRARGLDRSAGSEAQPDGAWDERNRPVTRQRRGRDTCAPKRRLRREVRVAGCALLALMPLVSACTIGLVEPAQLGSSRVRSPKRPAETSNLAGNALRATERLEPGTDAVEVRPGRSCFRSNRPALAPGNDTEVPVVFPGYVLPDDSLEDSTHEGS